MNMLLFLVLFIVLIFPGLCYLVSIASNALRGNLERIADESGGLWLGVLAGWFNAMGATVLISLSYPFQRLLRRRGGGTGTPVVLIHGLYHNPAAWLLFARWLERRGYGNSYTVGYGSFTTVFSEIVQEAGRVVDQALESNPGQRVLLCGHSLGGLVCRALLAEKRFQGRIAGVATMGTPHRGSLLGHVAIGGLGRSLRPGSRVMRDLDELSEPRDVPRLALFTPLDNMVMPEQCLRVGREGWMEDRLPLRVSHVGMIYHRPLAERVVTFFRLAEAMSEWNGQGRDCDMP
ncbi:Alpha/beta hydrolase family protein [Paucidesulfovibrio gracilis DSM 16080]|uniref:Alpha/beta hydrolase family protein n=1 Tax=Paucidesulfovibrio gracilis DSM 16080 TaxID=1121449 RepID=A0A1T4Y6Q6_9BACT|nr:alpha/beta fold hydrolase [Paucidesulfovibrio gracilis]SKA97343.1 Alpha/beta hydrolase family protein [Paucidesulfovibrio gracilis DSM 16080]